MIRSATFLIVLAAFATAAVAQSGGVKGRVKGPTGKGIANATITVRQDGKDLKSASSDAKGDFRITGISPGKYNVVFEAPGYAMGVKYDVVIERSIHDLGDRLILSYDRGTFVIVQGSVFFKEGSSATGVKIELDQVNADGSVRSLGTTYTNTSGEFTFRRPEGSARLRITAKLKNAKSSKEIEVEEAAVYRLAITLPMSRDER